ncbi:hypothetical protein Patl1_14891 [Pistacia atlantica]|uniref:Uncharacterized protein n=1 Tax=Pistacia atlantica TaxID=434234 RepID=A0ACC1ASJ0_9ROSI|nr:hypothetical protein Patl1_14891 [Pistacia atlantica]
MMEVREPVAVVKLEGEGLMVVHRMEVGLLLRLLCWKGCLWLIYKWQIDFMGLSFFSKGFVFGADGSVKCGSSGRCHCSKKRGYYKCGSMRGCPARKHVERCLLLLDKYYQAETVDSV